MTTLLQEALGSSLAPSDPFYNIDREDVESNETLTHLLSRSEDTACDVVTNSASVWSRGVGAERSLEGDRRYASETISRKEIDNTSDSDVSISDGEFENFQQLLSNNIECQIEQVNESDLSHSEDEFEVTKAADDNTIEGIIEINQKSSEKDTERGRAILKQCRIWEGMLEARIHIQKSLLLANTLPHPQEFCEFMGQAGSLAEEPIRAAKESLTNLLEKLVCLQSELVTANNQFPSGDKDGSQECEEFSTRLTQYQNDVITEWEGKTRLLTNAFTKKGYANIDRSVLQQIEFSLSKREDLLERTQVKRLHYEVLGDTDTGQENGDVSVKNRGIDVNNCNEDTFDDTDFYHQLLQDLIHNKTTSNLGETGQKWLELNRNRSKSKRNINTKATKGRKIRYDVYPKLVSFMAPRDNSDVNDSTRNELFRSLFGLSSYLES